MSRVIALYIAEENQPGRTRIEAGSIVTDLGFDGDRKARPGSKRQVLIMPLEILEELGLEAGAFKENITTRGLDVMSLERGQRVRVGQALLEATVPCTPCDFIDSIRPGLQEESRGQRGMLFRVLEGGQVRVGDPVTVLD
ncbi:MAG: MOSC domain-containing protein [Chloroflexota bacterium]